MIFDSLTMATMIVSMIVLILVFGSIFYSHRTMKKNMNILARNTILMNADDEIKNICNEIIAINPEACPLLHTDVLKLVKAEPEKLKKILKEQLAGLKK